MGTPSPALISESFSNRFAHAQITDLKRNIEVYLTYHVSVHESSRLLPRDVATRCLPCSWQLQGLAKLERMVVSLRLFRLDSWLPSHALAIWRSSRPMRARIEISKRSLSRMPMSSILIQSSADALLVARSEHTLQIALIFQDLPTKMSTSAQSLSLPGEAFRISQHSVPAAVALPSFGHA